MKLKLHTVSRDNLFNATADYDDGKVTVKKGSRIKISNCDGYKPSEDVASKRANRDLVSADGILLKDIQFSSLSTAASFVAGRTSNGMITWKTPDGKYVRNTLKPKKQGDQ